MTCDSIREMFDAQRLNLTSFLDVPRPTKRFSDFAFHLEFPTGSFALVYVPNAGGKNRRVLEPQNHSLSERIEGGGVHPLPSTHSKAVLKFSIVFDGFSGADLCFFLAPGAASFCGGGAIFNFKPVCL